MVLSRHCTCQTGLANQSYYLAIILSRHVLQSFYRFLEEEKGSTQPQREHSQNFGNVQNLVSFETGWSHLFNMFLVDRVITYTSKN